MLTVPATDVKQKLGQYLEFAQKEPVLVQKSGRSSAVIISIDEYERLLALEDAWWGEKAKEAAKKGFPSQAETNDFIKRMNERLDEST